jgi:hypothetical protein
MTTLANILTNTSDHPRGSADGTLDNQKKTRAINRTLSLLQNRADYDFTKRTKEFYFIDGVYEYSLENYIGTTCQDDDGSTSILDFKSPYDLRPEDDRSLEYRDTKEVRQHIRRNQFPYRYSVENDNLIIAYPRQVSAEIHNCASLTANGTWATSGDATNLSIDTIIYETAGGSLNFDTSAGTSLVLTNSDLDSKDLESFQNKSHLTLKVDLPTITNFTSIKVRYGSSASDYWEKTETLPAASKSLVVGRNLFAFRWADATETGSLDVTAMDYIQITLTYSSATTDTDFRIDDIRIGEEKTMELEYYSKAMVKDSAGDYQIRFNPDDVTQTDVLLGDESEQAVLLGTEYDLFKSIGGKTERDRTDTKIEFENELTQLIKRSGHTLRRSGRTLNFRR